IMENALLRGYPVQGTIVCGEDRAMAEQQSQNSDRADKQFIITLAVGAGGIAVTLLGITSQVGGWASAVATVALLVYAGFYSRIDKQNRAKQWTHWVASRVSGYSLALILVAGTLMWNWWEAQPSGFSKNWPDAIQCRIELSEFQGSAPFVFYYLGTQK